MAWCKLEDTFYDDPKFGQLAEMLDIHIRHAQGLVASLWSWATRHAPDGDLRQLTRSGVERVVVWSGEQDAFVTACEQLQLLESRTNGLVIHGFWKRAESHKSAIKQKNYRKGVTVRKRNALPDNNVTVPSRVTLALRLEEREERRGEDIEEREDLSARQKPARSPPARSAEPTPIALVGRAWRESYKTTYERDLVGWGPRENGQVKNLLKTWPLPRVLELIPLYFAWPMRGPIDDGHPFGDGYNSFISKIRALDADTHAPERREDAAVVAAQLRDASKRAVEAWQRGDSTNGLSSQPHNLRPTTSIAGVPDAGEHPSSSQTPVHGFRQA